MIVLLDTSHDLEACRRELGGMQVGQLLTPLSGFKNRGGVFAIDNGAFSGFNEGKFLSRLRREFVHRDKCLFVALPDVVGNAIETLVLFHSWKARPELSWWQLGFVAQDGIDRIKVPWDEFRAVFIGGSTKFKSSDVAISVAQEARGRGKWVHVGRVNSAARFDLWRDFAHSIDGTGISLYSHMRRRLPDGTPLFPRGVHP